MHIINKLFFVTKTSNKNLFFIIIAIILTSLSDILSIGLILPYTKVILNDYSIFQDYKIINDFLLNKNNDEIFYFLSFALLISFTLKFIITILLRYILIRYTHGKLPSLQLSLAKKYQTLSLSEKNLKKDSDVIRNLKVLSESTISCLENVLRLIAETMILITISIYLLIINFKIFLIVSSIILIFGFFFNKILRPIVYQAGQKRIESDSKIILLIQDLLSSFKEIRVLGKENFFVPGLQKSANTIYKSVLINNITTIIPRYAIELIIILFFVTYILINFDNKMFLNDFLPNIAVFGFASLRIIPLSSSIIRAWVNLKYNLPVINTVYSDFKFNDKKDKTEIKKIEFKNLELKDISFEYVKSKRKVLNQINFKIEKKQTVGILGESGSGKTTFVNLLIGLLDLKKGNIFLNGNILNERLYNKIKVSYIAQDNLVIKDTIKKNISLENKEELIDEIKLQNSIKFSNLSKVIQKNDLYLDSVIGEDGLSLSGGESKRLSIARALYHDCDLLILDEATNSLDESNKIEIREHLKLLKSKIAMIIISHNQEDLNNCDMIYRIENGNINLIKRNEK
tara:strand:- start:921 stop:2633 length:1713 start_codon:yes stop_codon:yes gene_type:complete